MTPRRVTQYQPTAFRDNCLLSIQLLHLASYRGRKTFYVRYGASARVLASECNH